MPGGVEILLFKGTGGLLADRAKGQKHIKGVGAAVVDVCLGGDSGLLQVTDVGQGFAVKGSPSPTKV